MTSAAQPAATHRVRARRVVAGRREAQPNLKLRVAARGRRHPHRRRQRQARVQQRRGRLAAQAALAQQRNEVHLLRNAPYKWHGWSGCGRSLAGAEAAERQV